MKRGTEEPMRVSKSELERTSKFLSYVLRHCPEDIGVFLDPDGWASISELINKAKSQIVLSEALIKKVVETSSKQRFKISDDGQKIRANQGHSVEVDLKLIQSEPPAELFHGTATRFLNSINQEGLRPGQRHHVHLSTDIDTATSVGKRYGKPVILKIDAENMFKQGYSFYLSDNQVWLTDHVPPEFFVVI